MSIFLHHMSAKPIDIILFSALKGFLTHKGAPASNALITLRIELPSEPDMVFNFKSIESGFFQIPEQRVKRSIGPIAHYAVHQSIVVQFEGEEFEVWRFSKSNDSLNPETNGEYTELGGKPVGVTCELTDKLRKVNENALGMTSIQWQGLK